jgi:hypothetical protein
MNQAIVAASNHVFDCSKSIRPARNRIEGAIVAASDTHDTICRIRRPMVIPYRRSCIGYAAASARALRCIILLSTMYSAAAKNQPGRLTK